MVTWTEDPLGADTPLFGFCVNTVAVGSLNPGGLISSFRDVLPRVVAAVAAFIPCRSGTTSLPAMVVMRSWRACSADFVEK
jgi:hypothetical protein